MFSRVALVHTGQALRLREQSTGTLKLKVDRQAQRDITSISDTTNNERRKEEKKMQEEDKRYT